MLDPLKIQLNPFILHFGGKKKRSKPPSHVPRLGGAGPQDLLPQPLPRGGGQGTALGDLARCGVQGLFGDFLGTENSDFRVMLGLCLGIFWIYVWDMFVILDVLERFWEYFKELWTRY